MSSATSIDRDIPVESGPASRETAPGADGRRDTFRAWHFFVLLSLVAATAALVVTRQGRPEQLILVSLAIGAAGFAAAMLYRTLLPLVASGPPPADQPLREGVRAGLEREKQLVLRALKELEFDRAMGKVSPKDFEEMSGRLRARAISLMRQLDAAGGYRELIERELAARHRPGRAEQPSRTRERQVQQPAAVVKSDAGDRPGQTDDRLLSRRCACGTANDADAAFCKRCGSSLAPSA